MTLFPLGINLGKPSIFIFSTWLWEHWLPWLSGPPTYSLKSLLELPWRWQALQINLLTVIFLICFWNLTLLIKQYWNRNPHLPTSRLKDDHKIRILPEWVGRVMVLHSRVTHITVWICVKPRPVQTPWQPRAELDYITAMASWEARWQIMLYYDEKYFQAHRELSKTLSLGEH